MHRRLSFKKSVRSPSILRFYDHIKLEYGIKWKKPYTVLNGNLVRKHINIDKIKIKSSLMLEKIFHQRLTSKTYLDFRLFLKRKLFLKSFKD